MSFETANEHLRNNLMDAMTAHIYGDKKAARKALGRIDRVRRDEARRELSKIQPELIHLDTRVAKDTERLIRTIYGGKT